MRPVRRAEARRASAPMATVLFRKIGLEDGYDETRHADYFADR